MEGAFGYAVTLNAPGSAARSYIYNPSMPCRNITLVVFAAE